MKLTSLLLALSLLQSTSGQIQLVNPNQPPALPLITNAPTATAFNWPCSNTYLESCTSTNRAGVQLARRPGTLWDGGGFWNFDRKNFGDCAEICTEACEAAVFFNPTSCYIVTSNYFYGPQNYWFSNTDANRQDITAVTVVNTDLEKVYGGVASMWPIVVVASSLLGGIEGGGGAVPGSLPTVAVSVATLASGLVSTTGDGVLVATLPSVIPGSGSPSIVLSETAQPAVPSPQAAAIESALSVLAASARTSVNIDAATPVAVVPSSVVSSASITSLISSPIAQAALPSPQAAIQSALSVLAANARTSSDVGSTPSFGAPISIPAFTASGDAIAWAMSIWAANARSSTVPTAVPSVLGSAVSAAGTPNLAPSSRSGIPSSAAASGLLLSGIAASSSLRSYTSVTRVLTPVGAPASLLPGEFYTTPGWVIIPPSPTAVVALPFGTSSALLPAVVAGPAPTACPSANGALTSLNGRQFQITCNAAHCGATATYPGTGVGVTNIASCIGQCTGSCIGMYYTSGWCMEIVGGGSRCPNMPGYTAAYPYTPATAVATSSVIPACGNGLLGLGLLCIL